MIYAVKLDSFFTLFDMKNIVGIVCFLGFFLFCGPIFSQNWESGIQLLPDNGTGLIHYKIKLTHLSTSLSAQRLEDAFMQKEGFIAVEASTASNECEVTCIQAFKKSEIADIIDFAGFEVAKSFEQ